MSLPSPPPLLTPTELQKFEAPLIALANLSGGDLRKLFYAFFSFLHRRTDFYCILPDDDQAGGQRKMGFREGQAEQILIASFRQFPLRKARASERTVDDGYSSVDGEEVESPTSDKAVIEGKSFEVTGGESSEDSESNDQDDVESDAVESVKELASPKKSTSQSAIRYTDEGKQVPVGNGGSTTRYVWTQTLEEATVHIPVPEGTRAKDLDVEITASSLSIRQKSSEPDSTTNFHPLQGTLYARVRPSECTWTMENTSSPNTTTILITLDKIQKTWWSTILSGDPEVDTTMVDSTRHIGTYDEKTQAQIRRIMFDQRQERLGLPTSSEWSGEGGEGTVTLPEGVEFIDGDALDKANDVGKAG
ncbi:hypothetical protein ACHAW6_002557 [Cyclotella cf. meneghiniana]